MFFVNCLEQKFRIKHELTKFFIFRKNTVFFSTAIRIYFYRFYRSNGRFKNSLLLNLLNLIPSNSFFLISKSSQGSSLFRTWESRKLSFFCFLHTFGVLVRDVTFGVFVRDVTFGVLVRDEHVWIPTNARSSRWCIQPGSNDLHSFLSKLVLCRQKTFELAKYILFSLF